MTGVLIPTASEAGWLEARRKGVTASEIAGIMGIVPRDWPAAYAIYHRKLGTLPEQVQDDAMALGTYMEDFTAQQFARRRPEFLVAGDGRTLFAHADRPWQLATPDRLLCDDMRLDFGGSGTTEEFEPVAVLECKIDGGSDEWGEDGSDQVPVHYRAQVLWQMDVMGVATGYIACLLWQRRQVRVYEITMDGAAREDLDVMRAEAALFLHRLEAREEPDVDWRPATTAALKTLHPLVEDRSAFIPRKLAAQYRAACKAHKAAERRKKLAENRIRERIGDARFATTDHWNGEPPQVIARRDVYPVKEHVRKATTVDKLVPVPPKEKQ